MESGPHAALRRLPKIDDVLASELGRSLLAAAPRWAVLRAVRQEVQRLRQALLAAAGDLDGTGTGLEPQRLRRAVADLLRPALRPVLNATGVVLHTNLGRAPLAQPVLDRLRLAGGYSNLEYRLDEGARGSRHEHLQPLLQQLTGAEAHLVVNNNAAAVLLMLAGLCAGGQAVVSRGELVEIGGSFRVPDVMRAAGTQLCEVGTTNRTHLPDYEAAIGPQTRALVKVHRSNFALVGFTAEVPLSDLCRCARERGVLLLCDLGSGALLDPQALHPELPREPTVSQAVADGCDVVCFSCDKLLGGPQAGVLAGRAVHIERLRHHPLLRALRPDKLTLLALEATLELYRDGQRDQVPVLRMMALQEDALKERATGLVTALQGRGVPAQAVQVESAVGGGSLPLGRLRSWAVAVGAEPLSVTRLEAALRQGEPPVIGRIADGRLVCDVRTLAVSELSLFTDALHTAYMKVIHGAQLA